MRYPSPADIAEMKARGYDRATIEKAEEQSKRWVEAQAVCSEIRAAFKEVKLGDGIGLSQARALDDHLSHSDSLAYRENDEKENWERVPKEILDRYRGSLPFCDAQGMRFHVPAYLISDLEGEPGGDIVSDLTRLGGSHDERFSLLNKEQRMAVRNYLLLLASDPDHSFDHGAINDALQSYWSHS